MRRFLIRPTESTRATTTRPTMTWRLMPVMARKRNSGSKYEYKDPSTSRDGVPLWAGR